MELSRRFGVSPPTLYKWKAEATAKARVNMEAPRAEEPATSIRVRSFSTSGEVEELRARVVELERELAKRNGQLIDLLMRERG
jgi:hypothetical protein